MSPIDLDDGTYIQHSGNVVAKYCDTNNTNCIKANYFTMNGGTLNASTTGYGSNAIACSYDITINGGNVTATATGDRGSRGMLAGSSITINGGSVTATATGDKCLGMRAGSSITLGWTRTTDRIYASSYGLGSGSISFKPGQAFAVNGTIADPSDISGKTLQPCLVLANNDDNTTAINDYNGQTLPNVVLNSRTLCKDGDWNTLCLPFSLTAEQIAASPLAGSTLMTLDTDAASYEHVTGFEDGTLYLNFVNATSIEAGKPYIVKWDSGDNITSPVFTDVTISNATANVSSSYVDFVGNFSSVVLTGGDKSVLYLGSGNTLYYPAANRTINALRAYFQLKGITAGDLSSGVKMYFGDGDRDKDAIRSIHSSDTGSQNEAWYNLDGRKLNGKPGQKGIYIHNGRKEAVK